jgi:uncharacterized membrane protein
MACLVGLVLALLAWLFPAAALAQDQQIELRPTYQTLEATWPGASYEFEVNCIFTGETGRYFDLAAETPENWKATIMPQYGSQEIGDIWLEPSVTGSKLKVTATPQTLQDPGEYVITLTAASGTVQASVDLTAVIKETYSLSIGAADDYNLSMTAAAGKDNYYSIKVTNTGSGTLEDIALSASKSSGWKVEFTPESIGSLASGSSQVVDVNIIPDAKATAGDYEITLKATSEQASGNVKVRVTAETPTVWGWVGIVIILLVIAGVIFIFMRFSRR